MKKWISWMAAGALSAVLLLSGCGKPSVHVMKAEASQEPFTLETKAVPEALHVAPVIPSVSGGLLSDLPDIGTTVEAGDVLFRIDSSQYESQAAALEAKIAESASSAPPASYGGAPIDNSMEASLLKQGIITRAEYNRIKGRSAVAEPASSGGGAQVDGNLASALAACGGASSSTAASSAASGSASAVNGDVTIRFTWWGGQTRHDLTQKVLDKYTELNPNVHFETTPSGWDGYFEKLATDTATGGMADIVQMDYMYISTYAKNGSLADLSSYASDGTLDISNVDDALIDAGTIGGKMVGIPLSTSLVSFIYNPSVLEEAGVTAPQNGWTWDDFVSICKTVKEKTGKYGFGGSAFIDTNLLNYWVREHGVSLFAEDNKSLGFDDVQILTDYFQLWKELIDAGAAPNPDEYEQIATLGNDASPVITGDAAFHQSWNNFGTIGANAGNDTLELLVPPVKKAGEKALWYKPGMFFSVSETSKVKDAAAAFISWFLNSDEANDIMLGERGTPSASNSRDHLTSSGALTQKQVEMFDFVSDAADYCGDTPAPDPSGISEINTQFKNIAYSVFYGQATPAEAAQQFYDEANNILATNN